MGNDQCFREIIKNNMMGPNSITILEELLQDIKINSGMKILDLGCGKALTSLAIAKKYNAQVFSIDLWVSASDNYKRVQQMGLEELIIPMQINALELPFPDNFFDTIISIDAYHYFGSNETYFDKYLSRYLKDDAMIAIAVPGMKTEVHECIPNDMKPYWDEETLKTWNSINWWTNIISQSTSFHVTEIKEMNCFDNAWSDWLKSDNKHAINDRAMLEVDGGRYMNLISIKGRKAK